MQYKVVKYRRTGEARGYPYIELGYALREIGSGQHALNARGSVRFFKSREGAKRALKKLQG